MAAYSSVAVQFVILLRALALSISGQLACLSLMELLSYTWETKCAIFDDCDCYLLAVLKA
jgi:hypothetical protein